MNRETDPALAEIGDIGAADVSAAELVDDDDQVVAAGGAVQDASSNGQLCQHQLQRQLCRRGQQLNDHHHLNVGEMAYSDQLRLDHRVKDDADCSLCLTAAASPHRRLNYVPTPAHRTAERIRQMLTRAIDNGRAQSGTKSREMTLNTRTMFIQLDVLGQCQNKGMAWKELSRWIKYEEKVDSSNRWSKPHVATFALRAVFELRTAVAEHSCVVDLDLTSAAANATAAAAAATETVSSEAAAAAAASIGFETGLNDIASLMVDAIVRQRPDVVRSETWSRDSLINVFLLPHKHKHRQLDVDKPFTSVCHRPNTPGANTCSGGVLSTWQRSLGNGTSPSEAKLAVTNADNIEDVGDSAACGETTIALDDDVTTTAITSDMAQRRSNRGVGGASIRGQGRHRFIKPTLADATDQSTTSGPLRQYKANKQISDKLARDTEAASILIGQLPFVGDTIMAFFRLRSATILDDMNEVSCRTRFIFVVIGNEQQSNLGHLIEIGRAMAVLLSDKIFMDVAYVAKDRDHLLDGIDHFVNSLTVLPPSIWDPTIRLEPPTKTVPTAKVCESLLHPNEWISASSFGIQKEEASVRDMRNPRKTGRLFGGLIDDVRRRIQFYKSDFTDALHPQCIASTVFLYFACITPIVTFGGLMGQKTGGYMGTMEMLLAGALCGICYAAFSGQPLTIVGATGPLLVFESILYQLCRSFAVDFLSARLWVGIWVTVFLLLIVAFDLSYMVSYITRFTEESFAVLISVIFIYEACAQVAEIGWTHPVKTGHVHLVSSNGTNFGGPCICVRPYNHTSVAEVTSEARNESINHSIYNQSGHSVGAGGHSKLAEECFTISNNIYVGPGCLRAEYCSQTLRWELLGVGCRDDRHVADVFFFSIILFVGTFGVAMSLRQFRSAGYLANWLRSSIGDFAVLISIVLWSAIDAYFKLSTPKLNVPTDIKPTNSNIRGWIVDYSQLLMYWWLPLVTTVPAILGTVLIFLDQEITAVIVNRAEHKLKKGYGYHLDMFVLLVLIAICSLLGLPWLVAATVRSVTHVRSLIQLSDVAAPGERPEMLGVREQRVTGISIHLLIGLSTFLTSVLQFIPMPVLYGVFLYMGITSLNGVQFVQRIQLVFMPTKYQPDYMFLRHVKTVKVHLFTFIQVICSVLMWTIKGIKVTSIAFPLMLVALIVVRKILDHFFTQKELFWLDHLLPDQGSKKVNGNTKDLERGSGSRKENVDRQDSCDFSESATSSRLERQPLGKLQPETELNS